MCWERDERREERSPGDFYLRPLPSVPLKPTVGWTSTLSRSDLTSTHSWRTDPTLRADSRRCALHASGLLSYCLRPGMLDGALQQEHLFPSTIAHIRDAIFATTIFHWQGEAGLITCAVMDAPEPPHQTDAHHKGDKDHSHHWSHLHHSHRAWTQGVSQRLGCQVRRSHANMQEYSLLCSGSGCVLATGETLSLLVLCPVGGLSGLETSELRDWVTTMGLERFLISHWEGSPEFS